MAIQPWTFFDIRMTGGRRGEEERRRGRGDEGKRGGGAMVIGGVDRSIIVSCIRGNLIKYLFFLYICLLLKSTIINYLNVLPPQFYSSISIIHIIILKSTNTSTNHLTFSSPLPSPPLFSLLSSSPPLSSCTSLLIQLGDILLLGPLLLGPSSCLVPPQLPLQLRVLLQRLLRQLLVTTYSNKEEIK